MLALLNQSQEILNSMASKTTQPKDTGHSELGGSGAPVWLNCTGSIGLSRKAPPETHTDDSDRGNLLHEYAAKRLKQRLDHAKHGTLFQHPDDFYKADIEEPDREIVEDYVNYVYYVAFEGAITGKKTFIEVPLILNEKYDQYGTPDAWAVFIDDKGLVCVVVVDLKTGRKERDPQKDEQLAYYLLCIRKALKDRGKDLDYGLVHFYQPMFGDDQFPPYKWTKKALDSIEKKINKIAKEVYVDKKLTFKVGAHCEKCRVSAMCPTYAETLEKETDINLPATSDLFKLPEVESLSDEQIAAVCVYGESLTSFVKDAIKLAIDRHKASDPVKGLKIVRGRSNRKIADPDKTVRTFYELGFGDNDIYKRKLKGIGDLERLAGKDVIEKLVVKPEGKLTVAPSDDPREEVLTPKQLLELELHGNEQSEKNKSQKKSVKTSTKRK